MDRREEMLIEASKASKIKVSHPGILEIEEGEFVKTPYRHFVSIVDKKGYSNVVKALLNLERWNKKSGSKDKREIADKARSILDRLKREFGEEKKESVIYLNTKKPNMLTESLKFSIVNSKSNDRVKEQILKLINTEGDSHVKIKEYINAIIKSDLMESNIITQRLVMSALESVDWIKLKELLKKEAYNKNIQENVKTKKKIIILRK